jgi:hypothetical protein
LIAVYLTAGKKGPSYVLTESQKYFACGLKPATFGFPLNRKASGKYFVEDSKGNYLGKGFLVIEASPP